MPKFDGTGPGGKGPKTGGQMGKCDGAKPQAKPFDGRGQGMGQRQTSRGAVRGMRSDGRGRNV